MMVGVRLGAAVKVAVGSGVFVGANVAEGSDVREGVDVEVSEARLGKPQLVSSEKTITKAKKRIYFIYLLIS